MPPSSYSYSSSLSSSVSSTRPLLLAAAAALLATAARAHSAYRSYLPNGFAPSSTSYGHIDGTKYGNSNLNSFGSDLNAAGLSWSRTLCTRDSECSPLGPALYVVPKTPTAPQPSVATQVMAVNRRMRGAAEELGRYSESTAGRSIVGAKSNQPLCSVL